MRSNTLPRARVAVFFASLFTSVAAMSQAWRPDKPVEFTVATVAGGNSDNITRLAQKILQDRKLVTTPMVVVNRTGGNQTLAFNYVASRRVPATRITCCCPTP